MLQEPDPPAENDRRRRPAPRRRLLAATVALGALAVHEKASAEEVITQVSVQFDEAHAIAIQTDGKIVLAGYAASPTDVDFSVVRYNTDLTLDLSFDTDGMVITDIAATSSDQGRGVAIQSDGKIVVAGYRDSGSGVDFAVVRYNTDGSLDTSFDTDGIVTTALQSPDRNDYAAAVAIQSDGKIVVAGYSERTPGNHDFAVVRYNANGSLDTSFDTDGIVTTKIRAQDKDDVATSMALQADGKIVVAGYIDDGGDRDIAIVRYNSNGGLDATFDADGILTTNASLRDMAHGVAIQSDGKIVVTGQIEGTLTDLAVVRYDTNGTLDASFDGDGIATKDITPGSIEVGIGIAIQSDGKILVAGYHNFNSIAFLLARFNPDGSLDTTCDGDGISVIDLGGNDIQTDIAYGVRLQSVDKIVAAGYSSPGATPDFALVRYDGDCTTTAVELEWFTARTGDGTVDVEWKTASELNNLGFHVHRATAGEGPYVRITESAIPGLGSSPVGAEYRFRDTGLTNGVTYYYKLEDIETTGKTTLHGPVQATPAPTSGTSEDSSSGSSSTSPTRIIYGKPENNRLRVLSETRGEKLVELETEGFYAEPQEDGSVRLFIPDFELPVDRGPASIPVRRSWVEVVAGRKVSIASVRELDVESIRGLRPSNALVPDVEASADAIRVRLWGSFTGTGPRKRGLEPEEAARLLSVGFQQDVKKALVELSPLRWSRATGELRLARRLLVRLSSREPDPDEIGSGGSRGRRYRRGASRRGRAVVARLSTVEAGLHEISFEELGYRGSISLASLRLSRQGEAVAFHVEPPGTSFGRGSRLYFVSEGARANRYGSEAVYELELAASGLRMLTASASPAGGATGHYWHRLEREENRYYQAALVEAPDLWLWDILFAPEAKTYPFEVSRMSPRGEPPRLRVWLSGASDFPAAPDHHLRVSVNGALVAETAWNGKQATRIDAELPPGLLAEGENRLELHNVGDTNAPYSMVMLDRFALDYPRHTVVEGGRLEGRWSESGTATLSGLGDRAHLLDVTDEHPVWLTGVRVDSEGSATFRAEAGHRYLGVASTAVRRPEIRRAIPSRLTDENQGADYLVVGPMSFLEKAEPLLRLRRSQGLSVMPVPVEAIFDIFGFGERRPEAIKEFLAYAYHRWRGRRVRYVLLMGDGLYDYKDYLKTGNVNHLPPLMVKTTFLWTASDPMLAAVNGDDILPDVAIGRLPAANAEELRIMIDKILAYENGDADLSNALVLIADNADAAGDFVADAEEISRDVLSPRDVRRLYLSDLGAGATQAHIRTAFDEGASLMSYVGHGGIQLWAGENVFDTASVSSLAPQAQQPLLVTMNCLNGYFHFPYFDSLSERLLKVEGKGAIAAFSPSGLSLNAPAHRFHSALLDAVFNEGHERLGDAVLAAQSAYAKKGAFPELLLIYHLLGDPALTLKS